MKRSGRLRVARSFVAAIGIILLTASFGGVNAHDPTPKWAHKWTNGQAVAYQWDTYTRLEGGLLVSYTVPTWLRTVLQNVLEVGWADPNTNNSNGPNFSLAASSSQLRVFFSPENPVTGTSNWLGVADTSSLPNRIWIRSDPQRFSKQWCDLNSVSGCPDAGRAAIHEVSHVGGALGHNLENVRTDSIMHGCSLDGTVCSTLSFPFNGTTTWNWHTIGRCDEARMQLLYDVASLSGPYANCFDHIPGAGTTGLIGVVTAAPSAGSEACFGTALAATGRLAIKVDATNYGAVSGNTLASRVVYFDRKLSTTTTWTVDYASTTATTSSTNNWSHAFSASGTGVVTYDFRAHYKGEAGVDGDYSPVFSFTWSSPC